MFTTTAAIEQRHKVMVNAVARNLGCEWNASNIWTGQNPSMDAHRRRFPAEGNCFTYPIKLLAVKYFIVEI